VDPHWFHCGSGYGYGSGFRVLITKIWEKIYSGKKFIFFYNKNWNLTSPYRLQEKSSSLKSEHFLRFYWPSWILIRICTPNVDVDSDPADQSECWSGSKNTDLQYRIWYRCVFCKDLLRGLGACPRRLRATAGVQFRQRVNQTGQRQDSSIPTHVHIPSIEQSKRDVFIMVI
jgi:hypothetical protein